ncbi:MAG TPA: DUF3750 domain-containing protein [Burkholderiales bacterium]|nr:DUF3750 domain-containing protein [Burkholderiales bacterium]
MKCVVQLRYAPVPYLGAFASHYWFVVFDQAKGECHRWEVWQTRNAGGWSLGHVHCNLKHPDDGVGAGPYRLAAEWNGAQALALRAILEQPQRYPHCERYAPWPGPNSNTFAAWVLREAGIQHPRDRKAIGWNYPC